jgi:hypothetical protein
VRISDPQAGQEILKNLKLHQGGTLLSTFGGVPVIIEAFDEPLIAQQIQKDGTEWKILANYGVEFPFVLDSLSLDEWDRFHGYTSAKVPFVMSRKAQASFFNMLEEFDDESITADGKTYEVPPYWSSETDVEDEFFWSKIYEREENPGWNLGEPAEALKDMIPRLKISKLYQEMIKKGAGHKTDEASEFVKDKLRAAEWLIKSIQNRQKTIEKVSKAIVAKQQDFFKKGPK